MDSVKMMMNSSMMIDWYDLYTYQLHHHHCIHYNFHYHEGYSEVFEGNSTIILYCKLCIHYVANSIGSGIYVNIGRSLGTHFRLSAWMVE